ncbi:hypothetical protein PV694_39800, partial [Streptomyces sp. ME01-18h]|nr:hypothetical protein [Streptomyces sp. ME01-18h]
VPGVVLPVGAVVAGLLSPGCAVPRPAGASVGAGPDGRTAVRWTGGVPDAVPLCAGAGLDGAPLDGRAVARWTGGVPDAEPLFAGAGVEGVLLPTGRAVARWTGGAPGAVPLSAGAEVEGVLLPDGRTAARWTGGVPGVVLPVGAVAAGLLPGCAVPRPAGASVGAGPDGRTAVRWTGGVPGAEPLCAGAGLDGAPPSGRRTGDAGAVASPDAPGA